MQPGCEKFEVTQNIFVEGKDVLCVCDYLSHTAPFQMLIVTASTIACRHVSYRVQGLLPFPSQVSYVTVFMNRGIHIGKST